MKRILAVGVVLLFLGSSAAVYANSNQALTSGSEAPDLIIVDVRAITVFDDVHCLVVIIKNIGFAPATNYTLEVVGGRFQFFKRSSHDVPHNEFNLHPGESYSVPINRPFVYLGIFPIHCHVSTNVVEENSENNDFDRTYFLVCFPYFLNKVWVFYEFTNTLPKHSSSLE